VAKGIGGYDKMNIIEKRIGCLVGARLRDKDRMTLALKKQDEIWEARLHPMGHSGGGIGQPQVGCRAPPPRYRAGGPKAVTRRAPPDLCRDPLKAWLPTTAPHPLLSGVGYSPQLSSSKGLRTFRLAKVSPATVL
jgi:hypothetical protein